MQPENKQKIFNIRTVVGLVILSSLCLVGIIFSPRESIASVSVLCMLIVAYVIHKGSAGNVEAQKPIPSSRVKQMSAIVALILGVIGFICSPFFWSLGFAAIGIVLSVIVLSDRHYYHRPGVNSELSSAFVMSIVGLVFSCITFVLVASMMTIASWPIDPGVFIRGIFEFRA